MIFNNKYDLQLNLNYKYIILDIFLILNIK